MHACETPRVTEDFTDLGGIVDVTIVLQHLNR